jgi:hypothetical protein
MAIQDRISSARQPTRFRLRWTRLGDFPSLSNLHRVVRDRFVRRYTSLSPMIRSITSSGKTSCFDIRFLHTRSGRFMSAHASTYGSSGVHGKEEPCDKNHGKVGSFLQNLSERRHTSRLSMLYGVKCVAKKLPITDEDLRGGRGFKRPGRPGYAQCASGFGRRSRRYSCPAPL